MSDFSTRLGLPYLMPAQAQKHVTVNESLRALDALVQTGVRSRGVFEQPASPDDGQIWIVPPGKSGEAWASFANWALACWRDGAWVQLRPRAGWRVWIADEGRMAVYDGESWRGLAGAGANRLINPGFTVNQRVFTGGALSAGAYGHDRWKAGESGCDYSVSKGRVTLSSGALVQVMESPDLSGRIVTVSVEDPSVDLAVDAGGAGGVIAAGSGRRGVSFTVPAGVSGHVALTLTANQAGAASFARPKLEAGDGWSGFEPRAFAQELSLCERYYQKSFEYALPPGDVDVNNFRPAMTAYGGDAANTQWIEFTTRMRDVPLMRTFAGRADIAPGSWGWFDGTAWRSAVNQTFDRLTEAGFICRLVDPGALTFGRSYLVTGHWTADAEL